MEKNFLLICNGVSGSGKTSFINKYFKYAKGVYNLKSFTTRKRRPGEVYGEQYYFVNEAEFDCNKLATRLFVNEAHWQPGEPKWLYGVPEFEINNNLGRHLIYDVIEPRYSRQLIDWFDAHNLNQYYEYKILWFLPSANSKNIVAGRANMPNDTQIRAENTCEAIDFLRAGVMPTHLIKSSAEEVLMSQDAYDLFYKIIWEDPVPVPNVRRDENCYVALAEMSRRMACVAHAR